MGGSKISVFAGCVWTESRARKEKVADSKISGYVLMGPNKSQNIPPRPQKKKKISIFEERPKQSKHFQAVQLCFRIFLKLKFGIMFNGELLYVV